MTEYVVLCPDSWRLKLGNWLLVQSSRVSLDDMSGAGSQAGHRPRSIQPMDSGGSGKDLNY